ncbi:CRTAC1 family protein, partial [candidate division WOR-3 bacterium]|nr:CRTAC1 family protein [candidate division WOR-3 bacterium]
TAEGRRTSTAELRKAKTALDEALAHFRWDPQQEATPAQLYYLTGRFWDLADAYGYGPNGTRDYCRTLAAGDSRNYWTALADTAMQKHGQTNPEKQLAVGRGLLHYVGPIFTDVTDSLGLEGRRESRVAWGDYNNDGYQDLLLNGSALFRNRAGKGFTNVTDSVGLTDAKGRGGLFADLNNDGWLDLYVSGADGGGRLYKNDSGRFVALSDRAGGPDSSYPTEGAGWADFDNDGWVDLYCANYEDWEKRTYYPDQLFQNQNGYLTDVTGKAGIVPPYNKDLAGRGVNWGDFNNDGYPDCYVSNYRLCENFLWVNNHDSTFTNQAAQLGVAGEEVNNWYGHTIGSAWADYDNDGDLDLFCANLAHPRYIEFSNRSLLYENQLGPVVPGPQSPASSPFADRRSANGIRYEETHSDPAWADVDNDGDLDLYLTSIYEGRRSFLYLNPLGPSAPSPQSPIPSPFQDVTWLSGTRVFNGWGCAFADFDNDGDMDLAVGSGSGFRLFRNDTRNGNHWLKVNVVGRQANRAGIGARVIVTQGDRQQMREVEGGKGTMSQNSLVQHFGLGPSAAPVQIEVSFGPNSRVVLKNVKPNQAITVTERP